MGDRLEGAIYNGSPPQRSPKWTGLTIRVKGGQDEELWNYPFDEPNFQTKV